MGCYSGCGDRVPVKLARASDDSLLWSEQYNRVLDDVFAVQDEVTRGIVEVISVTLKLGRNMTGHEPVLHTSSLHVYDLYLLGRHHWLKRTEDGMRKALDLFERAVAIDPRYAPAYSGIADASAILASYQFAEPANMYPRASAAALRALDLDPNSAEAHASLGFIKMQWEWDWEGVIRELSRAIELNPNLENAQRWLSAFLAGVGRYGEPVPIARRVIELDPLSLLPRMNLGIIFFLGHQFEAALAQFEDVLTMDPQFPRAYVFAGVSLTLLNRHDEALDMCRRATELSPTPFMQMPLACSLAQSGRVAEARQAMEQVLPKIPNFYIACWHALLSEEEEMYSALERAITARDDWMYSIGTQPWMSGYRDTPRLKALLDRLRLPSASGDGRMHHVPEQINAPTP